MHSTHWTRSIVDFASQYTGSQTGAFQSTTASSQAALDQQQGFFDISRVIQADAFGMYLFLALLVGGFLFIRIVLQARPHRGNRISVRAALRDRRGGFQAPLLFYLPRLCLCGAHCG